LLSDRPQLRYDILSNYILYNYDIERRDDRRTSYNFNGELWQEWERKPLCQWLV
jgi:hypothetical protein